MPCEKKRKAEEAFDSADCCYLCGKVSRLVQNKDYLAEWMELVVYTSTWPGNEGTPMEEEDRDAWEDASRP